MTALSIVGLPVCFVIAVTTKFLDSSVCFPVSGSTKEYVALMVWPSVMNGVFFPGGIATSCATIIADGSFGLIFEPS